MIGTKQLINGNTCKSGEEDENKIFTVAVEGNIGSGKSTFLKYFENVPGVEVIPEPVSKWKDVNGHNTLDLMYKDANRWSLAFQSYVQLTMMGVHNVNCGSKIKMMERSIYSARYCFVENLYKGGLLPDVDYAILSEFYDWIQSNENTHVDLIVYLQSDPLICQERIQMRNRYEEKKVPIEYLQSLHDLHEDWLIKKNSFSVPAPVLVINTNAGISEVTKKFEQHKSQILSYSAF
ncbi:hypothetical protein ScPMuIL_009508 [Solemya velum]